MDDESPGTLKETEWHPAAESARAYLNKLGTERLFMWLETFSSCAISGNRMAEVCAETLRRCLHGEKVSDRYLLGMAWMIRDGEEGGGV